ncbi:MAG TPA: prolipoprotein diacylglyceryl transferase [Verrucomicrobiota bacterium]|nr:prolipoprotein diacylglyceryl transferase [Verrucomicrobiota bacterium]
MHPIAFNLGSFPVYWYGVMLVLGILAGLWTSTRRAPLAGIQGEKIADLGPWLILGAVIGGRTLFVLTYSDAVFRDPLYPNAPWTEVFMIRRGGLIFYGGLIGAALACIIYCRVRKLQLWKVADILAPGIALGYVFGRIGCFLNGCCFGSICQFPWAVRYPNQSSVWHDHFQSEKVGALERSLPVHPSQIYDSLLNIGLYLTLAWMFRRRKFDGQVFAAYLVLYAITRSFVELFRGDYPPEHIHGGLTSAHLVSIGIFAAGAVLWFVLRRRSAGKRG